MLLEQINQPNDIKKIAPEDYDLLAGEIRAFLLDKVSKNGGHLASNLGTVELTMALHLVFDAASDKLLFDVGHQCYTHKILTGRRKDFDTLRQYGGLSGFPKKSESPCDLFDTGHSSTSISQGVGLVKARELTGGDYSVVSVIGDGSMTGGIAWEALSNASQLKSNFIIVLNDNNMSISNNVGGFSRAFQNLRTAPEYNRLKDTIKNLLDRIPAIGSSMVKTISQAKNSLKQMFLPGMIFENMSITYLGPIDGHDIPQLVDAFEDAKRLDRPVVVHVITEKGKGYAPAMHDPEKFHGVGPFDPRTGKIYSAGESSYTDYAAEGLLKLAEEDERVVAVTAAMPGGTGLKPFSKKFPSRIFDVGIAEEHAVSYAAGMAAGGLKPYVCIYSTFLQRAYDQIVQDVALQKLPVRFLVDRAGLVGQDGETHQGMLDGGYLQTVPGLTIMAPRDGQELLEMLDFSLHFEGPLAIRYPRRYAPRTLFETRSPLHFGKAEVLLEGRDIVLFAAGSMVQTAVVAADILTEHGFLPTLVNARFLKPFDEALLKELAAAHSMIAVLEENNRSGALGQQIADFSARNHFGWEIVNPSPEDSFVPQGTIPELLRKLGLDAESIAETILAKRKTYEA